MSKKKTRRAAKPKRAKVSTPVGLESRLSIAHAAELHRTLLGRLEEGGDLLLDGSRVEEIDTAILQLLASLWRSGERRGIKVGWSGTSPALKRQADLIGVAALLHLPDACEYPHGPD